MAADPVDYIIDTVSPSVGWRRRG